jgi:hypothetical protein
MIKEAVINVSPPLPAQSRKRLLGRNRVAALHVAMCSALQLCFPIDVNHADASCELSSKSAMVPGMFSQPHRRRRGSYNGLGVALLHAYLC